MLINSWPHTNALSVSFRTGLQVSFFYGLENDLCFFFFYGFEYGLNMVGKMIYDFSYGFEYDCSMVLNMMFLWF